MLWKTEVVSFGTGSRQRYKKYTYLFPKFIAEKFDFTPLVFIHGGAWRDPNNTHEDFDLLAKYLDREVYKEGTNEDNSGTKVEFHCYSLDYRLSPDVVHPEHLNDVLSALRDIYTRHAEVVMIGHSVGAYLIMQVLHNNATLKHAQNLTIPKTKSILFLDGIYMLSSLISVYPEYEFFVKDAFIEQSTSNSLSDFVIPNEWLVVKENEKNEYQESYKSLKKLIIVQSTKDELLDMTQTESLCSYIDTTFKSVLYEKVIDDFGKHNDVYENPKIAELIVNKIIKI